MHLITDQNDTLYIKKGKQPAGRKSKLTGKDIRDVIKAVKDIRIEDGEKGYETGRCGENVAGIEKWERSYLSRMPGGKKTSFDPKTSTYFKCTNCNFKINLEPISKK